MDTAPRVALAVAVVVAAGACTASPDLAEPLPDPCALVSQADAEQIVGPALMVHGPDGVYDDGRDAVCRWIGSPGPGAAGTRQRSLLVSVARPDDACARSRERLADGAEAVGDGGYLVATSTVDDGATGPEVGGCAGPYAVTVRFAGPSAPLLSLTGLLPGALDTVASDTVAQAPTTAAPPADRFAEIPSDGCAWIDRDLVASVVATTGPYVSETRPDYTSCRVGTVAEPGRQRAGGPLPAIVVTITRQDAIADRSGADVLRWQRRLRELDGFEVAITTETDNLLIDIVQPIPAANRIIGPNRLRTIIDSVAERAGRS